MGIDSFALSFKREMNLDKILSIFLSSMELMLISEMLFSIFFLELIPVGFFKVPRRRNWLALYDIIVDCYEYGVMDAVV